MDRENQHGTSGVPCTYKKSKVKELRSFAKSLENDMDSVENAVAYDYSNGFVEGTNSRLKMIKRTMYGKCNR